MNVKAAYIPQGLVVAEASLRKNDDKWILENPALIVIRGNEANLIPLLHLVEENYIVVDLKDVMFNTLFTPKRDIVNLYNQIFGSGIVLSTSMPAT